jgi:hypothetical protein
VAVIYLYAFVDDAAVPVANLSGIDGRPVEVVAGLPVAAVVSFHENLEVRAEVAALREHDSVVAALVDRCAVAPVRFGTVMAGRDALRRQMDERAGQLGPVLDALRGKVELALRAHRPQLVAAGSAPPEAGGPGHRYLAGLRGPAPDTSGPVRAAHDELAPLAAATTSHLDEDGTLLASYLLPADRVAVFRERLAAIAAAHPDLALSLTGPWAPYSFVGGGW